MSKEKKVNLYALKSLNALKILDPSTVTGLESLNNNELGIDISDAEEYLGKKTYKEGDIVYVQTIKQIEKFDLSKINELEGFILKDVHLNEDQMGRERSALTISINPFLAGIYNDNLQM